MSDTTLDPEYDYARCVECGCLRIDPDEFYDGLRCIQCAEEQDKDNGLE